MSRELFLAIASASLVGVVTSGGCIELRGKPEPRHEDDCTTCHGSPLREGDALTRSAPPFDLEGVTDTQRRGVGAHLVHLVESDSHAPVPCDTCHVVPEAVDSPGHADDALPADVIFGGIAASGDHAPRYDQVAIGCVDVYCHGGRDVGWVPSREGQPRCARCHGDPPPPPHPADDRCSLCHGEVIDANRQFVSASKHVDGEVQVAERCDACHGSGELGAPPPDLAGSVSVTSVGVGAHAVHLAGGESGRPLACNECHTVPSTAGDLGHLDSVPNAEVHLTGPATSGDRNPVWVHGQRRCVDSWCHGPGAAGSDRSPLWTSVEGPLGCQGCHGNPPPAPHPQLSDCERCHGEVVAAGGIIHARDKHVDGVVQVDLPLACDSCHGSGPQGLPPPDLAGNTDFTFPGVGAHQVHLNGAGPYRHLTCDDCHEVPATVLASGHIDTVGPAELDFGGVALAYGANPSYDGDTCAKTWCHGGKTAFGFPAGGNETAPSWTSPQDGLGCNSCHSMPPPTPHTPGPHPLQPLPQQRRGPRRFRRPEPPRERFHRLVTA
ncbi:MAG: CxxxxCH/CxxCH domain-containing protein [Polyangiaceae bacterium]